MAKAKKAVLRPQQDFLFLVLTPLIAAGLSWFTNLPYLVSVILFFGLPAAYLSGRKPSAIPRVSFFALTFAIIAVVGDIFAIKDGSWYVPTIFSARLFGLVPVEDIVWFFLVSYLILIYYEVYFDHATHRAVGRRMMHLYSVLTLVILGLLSALTISGRVGSVDYFYLKSSIILAIFPLIGFLIKFPHYVGVFLRITPYFAALFFLTELVGLHRSFWIFPGNHFIGWVSVGGFRFPIEELIFYIILFSCVTIAYFELFDDNRLKLFSAKHR